MRILLVTLLVVILDQVTKFLVKGIKIESLGINITGMPYGSSKPLIGEYVKLTFIENPGMAFGIDVGPKMFLTIFTIAASVFIFFYIYKHRKDGLVLKLSLALILAGAVGNLIDRTFYGLIYNYASLFHGKVVDFVQVEFWDFTFLGRTYTTWPIFNVADVSVSLGFLIILLFHNRIFKHESNSVETGTAGNELLNESSRRPLNFENNSNGSITPDNLKENSQIEDTKENAVSRPGGTGENKD
ncbi:MAG: signal peptidase II [Chlorobi bacterium]|nr:signal peptidase II [Chlorobiota bacterium]